MRGERANHPITTPFSISCGMLQQGAEAGPNAATDKGIA